MVLYKYVKIFLFYCDSAIVAIDSLQAKYQYVIGNLLPKFTTLHTFYEHFTICVR